MRKVNEFIGNILKKLKKRLIDFSIFIKERNNKKMVLLVTLLVLLIFSLGVIFNSDYFNSKYVNLFNYQNKGDLSNSLVQELSSRASSNASDLSKSEETNSSTIPSASPTPFATNTPSPEVEIKYVALTFDDGPFINKTKNLLSILKEKNVKATFFIIGKTAEIRSDIVLDIFNGGHEIGNHTYDHEVLTGDKITVDEIEKQIDKASDVIEKITGVIPVAFRPVQGSYNEKALRVAKSRDMAIYHWSWQSCPEDWINDDSDIIAKHVIENAENGHIILLHDMHDYTIDAVPYIIDGLRARGFEFLTASDLVSHGNDTTPVPGKVYFYQNSSD